MANGRNNPNNQFVAKQKRPQPKRDPRLEPVPGAAPPGYGNKAVIEPSPKMQRRAQMPGMVMTRT